MDTDSTHTIEVIDKPTGNIYKLIKITINRDIDKSRCHYQLIFSIDHLGRTKSNLYINPAKLLYGNNLNNCHSQEDLSTVLDKIQNDIYDTYGLYINLEDSRLSSLEINRNIPLDRNVSDSQELLDYLVTHTKFGNKVIKFYEKRNNKLYQEGAIIDTEERLVRFYDKLKEQGQGNGNVLRAELCLKTPRAIERALGTSCVNDIFNNLSTIQECYSKFMRRYFVSDILKALDKDYKDILKELKRNKGKRDYIKSTYNNCKDKILDIHQLERALQEVNLNKPNINRAINSVKKLMLHQYSINENKPLELLQIPKLYNLNDLDKIHTILLFN